MLFLEILANRPGFSQARAVVELEDRSLAGGVAAEVRLAAVLHGEDVDLLAVDLEPLLEHEEADDARVHSKAVVEFHLVPPSYCRSEAGRWRATSRVDSTSRSRRPLPHNRYCLRVASALGAGVGDGFLERRIADRAVHHPVADHEQGGSGCAERSGELEVALELGLGLRTRLDRRGQPGCPGGDRDG